MRLSLRYPALLAITVASCSTSASGSLDLSPVPPVAPSPTATLTFDDHGTLQLVPGELRTVRVTGNPPARYEVSFSVIDDAAGAWLDRTTVIADVAGRASVQLHAPNVASTFRLRATTSDGLAAELGVAVSSMGFGTVRVVPAYQGTRQVTSWTASVVAGATCDEIASVLPGEPAGALVAQGGRDGPVIVESAPVGPTLAVAIRGGHAMWGCADEPDLQAGTTREVTVNVKDTPVDLAATNLDLALNITAAEGLDALFAIATERLLEGFLPEGAEAPSLLDAMEYAAPAQHRPDFASQRRALSWDAVTRMHLAALQIPLRGRCRAWVGAGLNEAPLTITGRLTAAGDAAGYALFEVSALGGMTAEAAGIPPAHQMAWTADPGDMLRLGGTLFWMPSRAMGGAAWLGAEAANPTAESMREALAAAADCETLGTLLGGYPACDESCMAALCAAGLEQRWNIGLDTSALAGRTGAISMNASGPAQVDDAAAPISWTADWLGTVSDGESPEVGVQGEESASPSEQKDPN
jgi:hypothetical protein